MNKKQHIVRTSFSDQQWDEVVFLMKSLKADTPHELFRALVMRVAEEKRGEELRYGKGTPVPRETKAMKRAALDALSDDELTAVLEEKGCLSGFRAVPTDQVRVETDEAGQRVLRAIVPSRGMDDTLPLSTLMNSWEKRGLIP